LSPYIIGVIDGSVHRIRSPSIDQYLYWNEQYQYHSVKSLIIVNFDGMISSIITGVPGYDGNAANHARFFKELLGKHFVLGDSGFAWISYVIAGLKSYQLTRMLDCSLIEYQEANK